MCFEYSLNTAVIFILIGFITKQILTSYTIHKSIMF